MKARLTSISLTVPGRVFAVGEIVERGVDLPGELFDARVAAKTADLVGVEHEPSPEIMAAIEAYAACFAPLQAALIAAIDAVEAGGLAEARALVDVLTQVAPASFLAFEGRLNAIVARVREADEAELQSLSAAGSPVAAGIEAGAESAASKADGDSGGPSSSAENSSPAQADASTDAPQPNAGTDGDAAGASAPAAEPTPPSAPKPEAKKSARKGAAKAG